MPRARLTLLFAALLLAAPAWAQDALREAKPRNIVLIGWDGAQRAHVKECLQRNELPVLKKLSQEGALVDIDVTTGATDTKAGWSQILTGYHPQTTGVYGNGRFRDVPKGLSVFERLKEHFEPEKFVCAAVIGKSNHCGEIRPPSKKPYEERKQPEQGKVQGKKGVKKAGKKQPEGKIVEEGGVKYLVFEGSPYYTMHKSCDVWEIGLKENEKVGSRAIELLEKYQDKPFFFFVHFAEVDHSGHRFGENSTEYNEALISSDKWTGKIIDKLKALGLWDKTLVYVTADHGFNEDAKNHRYAPYVFLGTNDPKVRRGGMRQDITPTILARFGVELAAFHPKLDGEPLTQPSTKPVLKAPEQRAGQAKPGKKGPGRKKVQAAKQ